MPDTPNTDTQWRLHKGRPAGWEAFPTEAHREHTRALFEQRANGKFPDDKPRRVLKDVLEQHPQHPLQQASQDLYDMMMPRFEAICKASWRINDLADGPFPAEGPARAEHLSERNHLMRTVADERKQLEDDIHRSIRTLAQSVDEQLKASGMDEAESSRKSKNIAKSALGLTIRDAIAAFEEANGMIVRVHLDIADHNPEIFRY